MCYSLAETRPPHFSFNEIYDRMEGKIESGPLALITTQKPAKTWDIDSDYWFDLKDSESRIKIFDSAIEELKNRINNEKTT